MSKPSLRLTPTLTWSRAVVAALVLSALTGQSISPLAAATLDWDPTLSAGTALGGTGTWDDLTTSNWWDGALDGTWDNAGGHTARFLGTPGTVTLGGPISAAGLIFGVDGYTVTGSTLTLGGSGVQVTNAPDTATLASTLAGTSGLTKTGLGTLVLQGNNLASLTGTINVNAGTLSVGSDSNLGALANGVTVDGGTLLFNTTLSSARVVTLGAGGGTLNVAASQTATLSTGLAANANALTKSGTGTLTLSSASSRTGTTAINGGTVSAGNVSALGTGDATVATGGSLLSTVAGNWATNVNLNGGTFGLNATGTLNMAAGKAIAVQAGGGTVDVGPTAGSGSKLFLAAGQLSSSAGSTLAKTGAGVVQLSGANTGFLGTANIAAGTLEFQNVDALGSGTKTISVSGPTGDFVNSGGLAVRHNFTLTNGGILSANGNANGDYQGTVDIGTGGGTAALRYFQTTTTANGFKISGPLTGAGNLTVSAPAAATLTLSGNNTAYTGGVTVNTNATVSMIGAQAVIANGSTLAGGAGSARISITAANTAVAPTVVGTNGLRGQYFNFGSAEGTAIGIITGVGGTSSVKFAQDQLYLTPRVFNRTDAIVNIPNSGSGTHPIVPVPGYDYYTSNTSGDNSGGMWKGLVNITSAGNYIFTSASDDNSAVWIDGTLVVNSDTTGGKGISDVNGTITLSPGYHSIVVKWAQGGGGSAMQLSYNGPDTGNTKVFLGSTPGTVTTGSLAALPIGPISVTSGTGIVDYTSDVSASSLTLATGTTLSTTSITVSGLNVTGATTLNASGTNQSITLAPSTGSLTLSGAIGGTGSTGTGAFTVAGPYLTTFAGTNTYSGPTLVTGGELDLNAPSNAIPGNLTINATNGNGPVANIRLLQSNQIADTANLTLTQGILDMGANNDTVAGVTMNGGSIIGSGTLTSTGAPTLNAGYFGAGLGGSFALNKSGTGTMVLAGNNTYTGTTTVSGGILAVRGTNSLGAGGAGNETTISSGATLQTSGSNNGAENVTVNGTGVTEFTQNGALRNTGGVSSINDLTTGSASTVQVDSGELRINGVLNTAGGALTKTGSGTLTFTTPQASIPAVTLNGGALGFSGPQSFGAASVPAGRAYQFNSDPGAGVSITAPAGTSVIGNYAVDQTFLGRIAAASAGNLLLTADNANNLDFSAGPNVSLGATVPMFYSGTLTPNGSTYRLGGGAGTIDIESQLTGANGLEINGAVQLTPGNTFTGGITVNNGGRFIYASDSAAGNAINVITLNGGTLQFANASGNTGVPNFGYLGNPNPVGGGGRVLSIGAGGGTIDLPAFTGGNGGNQLALMATNQLTGSGALTKTGLGGLYIMSANNFSGTLTLAPNAGRVGIRGPGALANVTGIALGTATELDVDNTNGLGSRIVAGAYVANRINDAAPITFNGGSILYTPRGAAGQIQETFGAVTLNAAQNAINATSNNSGTVGAILSFGALTQNVGSTLRLGGAAGTFGAGTAGTPGASNTHVLFSGLATSPVVGRASIQGVDLAAYDTAVGMKIATYTAQGAAAFTPVAANIYNLNATGTATLDAGDREMAGLRFGGAATAQVLAFNAAAQKLAIFSGGIISDGGNSTRAIGASTLRGVLTAGPLTGNAAPRELFLHNNANTLTVFSQIVDNNGFAVSAVKDLDGTVTLDATNSTYSGGTFVNRGTLTVTGASGLGAGPVFVRNSRLNLNAAGSTTAATGTYTVLDQGEIFLGNNTAAYTATGDRFTLNAGSTLIGSNAFSANQSLNSLTRVSTLTAGGQVVLQPDAIIGHQLFINGENGIGTNTVKNLGTNADLYYGISGTANTQGQTVTLGAGTPWKGMSTDRTARSWSTGTIFANSDFNLQGLTRDGGQVTLTLGAVNSPGSLAIVNNTKSQIRANIIGSVAIGEDNDVSIPDTVTFVVTPNGQFFPNSSAATGNAKVLVQNGGTVDPGNFVALGAAANQNVNPNNTSNGLQNLPYPKPSPIIGQTTVEGGGRLLINDASGIGSAPDGTFTIKTNGILELGNTNAFFGRGDYALNLALPADTTGVARPSQFAFDPNAIIRISADNILKISQFVPFGDAAKRPVIEIAGANRTLTNQNNPFAIPVVGTPTIAPENINIANGTILTNDTTDRQINEGRGTLILGDGGIVAATSQTYLNIQESIKIPAGATVTLGSNSWFDGSPKLGAVQLTGPNSNVIDPTATVAMANGAQLAFGAANVWPDTFPISLPNAVTSFPATGGTAVQPGAGNTLLLNTGNFMEYVGALTGNGAVMANAAGTAIAVGRGVTSDYSSNIVFKNTNGQQPSLMKTGAHTLTLTGASDSQGLLVAQEGKVVVSGTGTGDWGEIRPQRGATITVDNTASALNNRLGTPSWLVGQGGTFQLIGNATTPVTETFTNIASGAGNFIGQAQNGGIGYVSVIPGAATTTLSVGTLENFQSAGQRIATTVLRSPALANLPGTYTVGGVLVPNPGNTGNGLVQVTTPNFNNQNTFGVGPGGNIAAQGGSTVVAVRGDYLGDTDTVNGKGLGFVTEDTVTGGMRLLAASEYGTSFRDNQNTSLNLKLSGTTTTSGDTRVQTLTFTPGSVLNISGTLPLGASASRVHLNAGGVFVQPGGTATINGSANTFLQANGGAGLFLHTRGDLNLNATAFSDLGVIKTGEGTLNVGAGAFNVFRGSLVIDGGTVNLAAGNTFANIRSQNGFTSNNHLYLNDGVLNLNGNSQIVGLLNSANELPGMGGTVTSATPASLTVLNGGRFAGTIDGAISLRKPANNTLLLTNEQTYSGSTRVDAGTLVLRDSAKLTNTSMVEVNNGVLQLDNGYLSNVTDRIPAATPVTLRGATVNLTGAAGQVASQTFNTLTIAEGRNDLTSNAGGGGANEFRIGNLVRPAGGGAILHWQQNYGFLGTAGNDTTAIRTFITNVNGSALTLNDGIIGGWAIFNGDHFATYRTATGVSYLSNTADGYANYDSGDATTALATHNVNDGTARTFGASKTINSWRIGGAVTETLNDGVTLTLDSGGLLTNVGGAVNFNPAANARNNGITSNSGELDAWINQNTTSINVPITGNIDLVKAGGGTLNLAPSSILTGTVTASSNIITMTNTAGLEVGDAISGGAASTFPAGTVIQAITPGVSIQVSNPAGVGGVDLRATYGNSYTGKTIVNGGTLNLNQVTTGSAAYTVPGDLFIRAATVTELNVGQQLNPGAVITIAGGARFNAVNAAGITETFGGLVFMNGSSGTGTANGIDRTAQQLTSTVNLANPVAISSTNTNPSTGIPFIGGFAGRIGFTNPGGATLDINSGNFGVGNSPTVGLRIGSWIAGVPTGIAEGGLIKSGNGLLTLDPDQNPVVSSSGTTTANSAVVTGLSSTAGIFPGMQIAGTNIPGSAYVISVDSATQITMSANATVAGAVGNITGQAVNLFGSPTSYTPVFNIQSGVVRADRHGALGSPFAITTVQNGAVLLGSNTASQIITGSVTLKNGATLGATINSFTLGAATDVAANQTVLSVPSGTVNIAAYDYYVPGTNNGNITINGRLTGSGNISIVGPQITQGNGGGGVITLGNPLLSGAGAGQNNYSGTISVGPNAVLQNQVALIGKNTAITRTTGNAMGSATIDLAGGRLRLRDDGASSGDVSGLTVNYGNNVTLTADSFLDANRQTSTTVTNTIVNLGTLSIPSGSKVLNVDSGNGYQVGFSSITGAGSLVKAGGGRLNINAIGGGFTGGIGIAGPVGNVVAPTFNTTTAQNIVLPASASVASFDVNGLYITEASKTLNVSGAFSVKANPGNNSGRVAVTNTTAINAGTVVNDGAIGPVGGAATLTASTGFSGSGSYLTPGADSLTLAGNLTSGAPKFAGTNTTTVTGTNHSVSGLQVQSGTLKLQPTASAVGSGDLRVIGSAATVASGSSTPTSAVTGTLQFESGVAGYSHTGNITNSGVVRASSGATTVAGVIAGPGANAYTPGLLEGYTTAPGGVLTVDGSRAANPGNFGIQMEPRMLQVNAVTQQAITGHTDNDTWIYTGYVKDDDGVFSFAENIDDRAAVWIDGTLVLNAANGGTSRVVSTAFSVGQAGTGAVTAGANTGTPSQNFGAGVTLPGYGSGWHLIEIRMNNGTGGSGPITGNGFGPNYGFGYKNGIAALDGADMIKPIDDGSGNLFVTPVNAKGEIQVDSGATLTAGGFNNTSRVAFGLAGSGASTLNVTGSGAAFVSQTDKIDVAATATNSNTLNVTRVIDKVVTPKLNVADSKVFFLNKAGIGLGELEVTSASDITGNTAASINIDGGTLRVSNTSGSATGDATINLADGVLAGNGIVTGPVTVSGGKISPGNSPGKLTVGDLLMIGGKLEIELGATTTPGVTYDQLVVNGTVDFGGADLDILWNTLPAVGDKFFVVANDAADAITGPFVNYPDMTGTVEYDNGYGLKFTVSYVGDSGSNSVTGGNDFVLSVTAVPEPAQVSLILLGLGGLIRRRRRA